MCASITERSSNMVVSWLGNLFEAARQHAGQALYDPRLYLVGNGAVGQVGHPAGQQFLQRLHLFGRELVGLGPTPYPEQDCPGVDTTFGLAVFQPVNPAPQTIGIGIVPHRFLPCWAASS